MYRQSLAAILILMSLFFGLAQLVTAQNSGHGMPAAEGNLFLGLRGTTPGEAVSGVGMDVFLFKGLAAGAEFGTSIASSDARISIVSTDLSYHFRNVDSRKVEPFIGGGISLVGGHSNLPPVCFGCSGSFIGYNINAGLIAWASRHVGMQIAARIYHIPWNNWNLGEFVPQTFAELHIGIAFRL